METEALRSEPAEKNPPERSSPWRRWLIAALFAGLGGLLLYSTFQATGASLDYASDARAAAQAISTDELTDLAGKRMLESLSFGWYSGYSDRIADTQRLQMQSQAARLQSLEWATVSAAATLGLLLLSLIGRARWIPFALLTLALVMLAAGLLAPVLTVQARETLPVIGEMVLQFESKGVLSAIVSLWQGGSALVAGLLAVFSVLIPVGKTLILYLAVLARQAHWSHRWLTWLGHLGKWSMADVFVVAILIALFATNGGMTQAQPEVGLGYFAAYVVLSMLATWVVQQRTRALVVAAAD